MLHRPELEDAKIAACLQDEYGLPVAQITFLPIGADLNSAVFRIVATDATAYFLKLRSGLFDEVSVALPSLLHDQGIGQVIPPLATKAGPLSARLGDFTTILYPFVDGRDGYEVDLSDRHWAELGTALRRIHTAILPQPLLDRIAQETYSPEWRNTVRRFLHEPRSRMPGDPIALEAIALLRTKRDVIFELVERAEQYAQHLQSQPPRLVVCHSDLHAGNILIGADDALYIVDWDNPILALKERDLMFVGGAQFANRRTPEEEESLFYRTYGHVLINRKALAYYRYERIVQDIAIYCEQILLTGDEGEDRVQALHYLKSNFLPNGTIETARTSDAGRMGRSETEVG